MVIVATTAFFGCRAYGVGLHAPQASSMQTPAMAPGLSTLFYALLAVAITVRIHGFFGAFLIGAIVPHNSRIADDINPSPWRRRSDLPSQRAPELRRSVF
jgi:hypothetical protein